MVKEELNSDRANYLIWRYLQESNYPVTALSLAKEWNQKDPEATFNPDGYVRHHTLVSILQKGLFYDDLERSVSRGQHVDTHAVQGFFGPLQAPPTPPVQEDIEAVDSRKRSVEDIETGPREPSPLSKRPKLVNGDATSPVPVPMDVDDHEINHENGHAYPSPKEVEQPETPNPLTNGPDTAIQLPQPTELIQETTFLSLLDGPMPNAPQIYHCKWNPRHSSVLAAAGTDPLVRFWQIPPAASPNDKDHVNGITNGSGHLPLHQWHAGDETASPNTCVSAFSWSRQGDSFAIATDAEDQDHASIAIYNSACELTFSYTGFQPPILSLLFNPLGNLVLGVGSSKQAGGICVTVVSATQQHTVSYTVQTSQQDLSVNYPKTVWTSDYGFVVCAADILQSFDFNTMDGGIEMTKKFELRDECQPLTNIAYDSQTRLIATSTESGEIDIWTLSGERHHTISAHRERITSLAWQPVSESLPANIKNERLLVSAGEDGIISIWDARAEGKAKSSMTMESAVQVVVFSPDGKYIAASTVKDTTIWNVEDTSHPVARWIRPSDAGFDSPRSTTSQAEDQVLCWDANGQSLACTVNNQIAVIKWSPTVKSTGSPFL